MSTRHAREGDGPVAESSNDEGDKGDDFKPSAQAAPDGSQDLGCGEEQAAPLIKEQPSHEDVMRLEADNDRMQRSNEAKNTVFDAIYDQLPEKIQSEMSNCGVGWRKNDSGLQFSQLSEAELKRLTI